MLRGIEWQSRNQPRPTDRTCAVCQGPTRAIIRRGRATIYRCLQQGAKCGVEVQTVMRRKGSEVVLKRFYVPTVTTEAGAESMTHSWGHFDGESHYRVVAHHNIHHQLEQQQLERLGHAR